jgi:hypothetical protein
MVPFIALNGVSVSLSQSGTTWTGSKAIALDQNLTVAVTCTGITGSPWSVAITADCPGGTPAKIFSSSGVIPSGGTQGFTTSVTVSQNPCGNNLAEAMLEHRLELVTTQLAVSTTKKKPAKKGKKAKKNA